MRGTEIPVIVNSLIFALEAILDIHLIDIQYANIPQVSVNA